MYAVFACVDDREFYDVCPNGERMVHLFDTEAEAIEWAVDYLIDKGDIGKIDNEWFEMETGLNFRTKEEALAQWQEQLSRDSWFHVVQVRDHRELGG